MDQFLIQIYYYFFFAFILLHAKQILSNKFYHLIPQYSPFLMMTIPEIKTSYIQDDSTFTQPLLPLSFGMYA